MKKPKNSFQNLARKLFLFSRFVISWANENQLPQIRGKYFAGSKPAPLPEPDSQSELKWNLQTAEISACGPKI
jgi:hypothetical protein